FLKQTMRHVRKVLKVRSTVERRDMSEKEKSLREKNAKILTKLLLILEQEHVIKN
ncbi:predicted protein, partial [Arabidopsis lyrata subsp. lyrata]